MSEENSKPLYDAIAEVNAEKAPDIVERYEKLKEQVKSGSAGARSQETADYLTSIADNIVAEGQENRRDLVDFFDDQLGVAENALDAPEDPLKKLLATKTDIDFEETGFGFGRMFESPTEELYNSLSNEELKELFRLVAEELGEEMEIPPERQNRLEQLSLTITALEGIQENIKQGNGTLAALAKLSDFYGTDTALKTDAIDRYIYYIKNIGVPMILKEGKTLADVFQAIKEKQLFDSKIDPESFLKEYDEWKVFYDQNGKLADVTNEKEKRECYMALAKFLKANKGYKTLETFLQDEMMEEEFTRGREKLPGLYLDPENTRSSIKSSLHDKAETEIGKMLTFEDRQKLRSEIDKEARKQGKEMTPEQIDDAIEVHRKAMVALHQHRLENLYVAEHFMNESADKNPNGVSVDPKNKDFWEFYNDQFDPKDETDNVAAATWDMMLKELLITAPLIIVSGGVAGVVAKGATMLARSMRLIALGNRLAQGGRLAKTVYQVGKIGFRASSLIIEGAAFEQTFMGLQGEGWLTDQPDYVSRVLWTAGALGLFKFAGAKGAKWSGEFTNFLKGAAPKFGNNRVVQLAAHLAINGHAQVAAMLFTSFLQHMSKGELDEFIDKFGEEVFHAYVSAGALSIAHGTIKTIGGKLLGPKPGGEGVKEPSPPEKNQKGLSGIMAALEKVLAKQPALKRQFDAMSKNCSALVTEFLSIAEGGKMDPATLNGFKARFAAMGTFIISFLTPLKANANASIGGKIKAIVKSIEDLGSSLAGIVDVGLGVGLIYLGSKNLPAAIRAFEFLVGKPRALLIFSSLVGNRDFVSRLRRRQGIAPRLRGRVGTAPDDVTAQQLGLELQNKMEALKQGKKLGAEIKDNNYELGPLSEITKDLTDTGERILNTLADNYTTKPFPHTDFKDLTDNFRARVAQLDGLQKKANGRLGGGDIFKLTVYALIITTAYHLWYKPIHIGSDGDDNAAEESSGGGSAPQPKPIPETVAPVIVPAPAPTPLPGPASGPGSTPAPAPVPAEDDMVPTREPDPVAPAPATVAPAVPSATPSAPGAPSVAPPVGPGTLQPGQRFKAKRKE